MANYFVINNKFKPYSFDELIKPYQVYGQAYREQEAAIDAARDKEFSSSYLDAEQDADAYNMYNAAQQGLQAVSDELATKGLSANLRNRLKSTARDYKQTMDALSTAQAKLDAERARRVNLGNDYVYRQENLRIGDFLNGSTPDQTAVKLSDLKKDIAGEFATRAGTISKETWNRVLNNNGNVIDGYYDITTQTGLTDAQLNSILDDAAWRNTLADPNISREDKETLAQFRNVITDKLDAIGYSNYDTDARGLIKRAINEGAAAGLGTTKHSYQKDLNFKSPELKFQMQKFNDEQEEKNRIRKINNGQEPFYTDPTTGEKWYSDGKLVWSTDAAGAQKQKPIAVSQVNKEGDKESEAASILKTLVDNQDLPIYMQDTKPGWFSSNDNTPAHKGGKGDFNEGKKKPVNLKDFGEKRTEKLKEILAEYNKNYKTNLTLNDIQIYEDKDLFNNEYQIVLKGQVIAEIEDGAGAETPSEETPSKVDSTTVTRRDVPASSYRGF